MKNRLFEHSSAFALLFTVALIAAGCSKPPYEVAKVDGTLMIKGQPGKKVHIEFVPQLGVAGPRSAADTDDQGRFTLHVLERDGSAPLGAVTGKHRIILSDIQLSESATGQGVPIRFGPEYTRADSSPLEREVKSGEQSIELKIP